jgi:phosphoribosylanthranilate isomerase
LKTKIKICGLKRLEDAKYCNEAKPDYVGFVFYKKSRRYVSEEQARNLKQIILPSIKIVGVFVNESQDFISEIYNEKIIDIIQLHGDEDEKYIEKLRKKIPWVEIWKAFKICSNNDIEKAKISSADKIMLDNGYGTGESFEWSLIKNIGRDFILAGGLTPENIPKAIEKFKPYAVDISSNVETDGKKDKFKIRAAVKAVREEGVK